MLAAILQDDLYRNANRPSQYSEADFANHWLNAVKYFVSLIDFSLIEQQLNISINVIEFYDCDGKPRYPMYCSRHVSVTEIDFYT